jgi:hypothetical protein
VEGDPSEPVAALVGNPRRVGVINGATCETDGVWLEGEAVVEKCFDGEGIAPGLEGEGERKAEIVGGRKAGRFVGEVDVTLLVLDSKSRRGEGWR